MKVPELQYATQFLRDKEMDQMEPPKPDYREAHEQESAAGGSANAEPWCRRNAAFE